MAPARQEAENDECCIGSLVDSSIGGDEMDGLVDVRLVERGEIGTGVPIRRGEKIEFLISVHAAEPGYPRPAEPARSVIKKNWSGRLGHWLVLMVPGGSE